jgi:hypothetical protein
MSDILNQNIAPWLVGMFVTAFIVLTFVGLLLYLSQPPCTAYQAIDGKPVCIEYQLNK